MKLKKILLPALLLGSLLLTACGKKSPQTVTLKLPSNPTTGYSWNVTQSEELFDITSEFQQPADQNLAGAGGTEVYTLKPKKEGTVTVEFAYARSWEEKEPETKYTYELQVDKQMQVKVNSMTGYGPGSGDSGAVPQMIIE